MDRQRNKYHLAPSGLNDRFYGSDLGFSDYIELMANIIAETRHDLHHANAKQIILANSPFSLGENKQNNGILLIHGLFDSPFYMQDLANYFLEKGFLVRAILLPGHGTVPGDLLKTNYEEWLKSVAYGITTLAQEVKNIYLGGYSLGGMLALYQALTHEKTNFKGLFLFAPAIQSRNLLKKLMARYHPAFTWISSRAKWYQVRKESNFAKYSSYTFNAGYQACKIIEAVNNLLKRKKLACPIFVTLSADDEIISDIATLSFFIQQPHLQSKLVLYTNHATNFSDARITTRSSHFPQLNIINFSHSCLTISPDNYLLGTTGKLLDFNHYRQINQTKLQDLYLGAATKNNLKKHLISRLNYNPDFANLLRQMDCFLEGI